MAVKKPASVPARDKPLVLQLRCCYYIPRSKVAVVSAELCKIFKTWLPFTPNWLCEAIQDWKLDDEKAEKVFVPLLVRVFPYTSLCTPRQTRVTRRVAAGSSCRDHLCPSEAKPEFPLGVSPRA